MKYGLAASIALALGVFGYLVFAPAAEANRSTLEFEPSPPAPGGTVTVKYTPASLLAGEDSLRLRVRSRRADSPFPRGGLIGELQVATLRPRGDGTYEGEVIVDPEAVYLAAAVEDFSGQRVDTNFGQLWDVFVQSEHGEPSIQALEARYRVLEPYNWIAAARWGAGVAERYPQNPFGWTLRYLYQSRANSVALPDSLRQFHEQKLQALLESGRNRSAAELRWLSVYARLLGQMGRYDSIRAHIVEIDPDDPAAVDYMATGGAADRRLEEPSRLSLLEATWRRTGRPTEALARAGVLTAARMGDHELFEKWVRRATDEVGVDPSRLADMLIPFDHLAGLRARLRRNGIDRMSVLTDVGRPLRLTVREFAKEKARALREEELALAADLAAAGDTAEALEAYARSAAESWDPTRLGQYADLLLAAGDTAAATSIIGLLLADPLRGSTAAESYPWFELTAGEMTSRAQELARRVRASADGERRLPHSTRLNLRGGDTLLAEDLAGSPTIFLTWEPDLPRADELLATFASAHSGLTDSVRVRRMVLTHTKYTDSIPPSEAEIVLDKRYEVAQGLAVYGLPTYVIVAPDLTVAAQSSNLEDAVRIAIAVSENS